MPSISAPTTLCPLPRIAALLLHNLQVSHNAGSASFAAVRERRIEVAHPSGIGHLQAERLSATESRDVCGSVLVQMLVDQIAREVRSDARRIALCRHGSVVDWIHHTTVHVL